MDVCTPFTLALRVLPPGDKYQEVQQRMDQLTREILGLTN